MLVSLIQVPGDDAGFGMWHIGPTCGTLATPDPLYSLRALLEQLRLEARAGAPPAPAILLRSPLPVGARDVVLM